VQLSKQCDEVGLDTEGAKGKDDLITRYAMLRWFGVYACGAGWAS
jgi:hypothetical protein